jgi:hypothetical protein
MEIVGVVVATLAGWVVFAVSTTVVVERICAARDSRQRRPTGAPHVRRRRL